MVLRQSVRAQALRSLSSPLWNGVLRSMNNELLTLFYQEFHRWELRVWEKSKFAKTGLGPHSTNPQIAEWVQIQEMLLIPSTSHTIPTTSLALDYYMLFLVSLVAWFLMGFSYTSSLSMSPIWSSHLGSKQCQSIAKPWYHHVPMLYIYIMNACMHVCTMGQNGWWSVEKPSHSSSD
jgi:hypothetical protein